MQIQLKQTEIVEALKQYIARQGFNLSNKTIDISFTAGRKDSGLTADICIEDAELPDLQGDLGLDDPENTGPALTVVPQAPVAEAHPAETTSAEEPAAPKSSLFG